MPRENTRQMPKVDVTFRDGSKRTLTRTKDLRARVCRIASDLGTVPVALERREAHPPVAHHGVGAGA